KVDQARREAGCQRQRKAGGVALDRIDLFLMARDQLAELNGYGADRFRRCCLDPPQGLHLSLAHAALECFGLGGRNVGFGKHDLFMHHRLRRFLARRAFASELGIKHEFGGDNHSGLHPQSFSSSSPPPSARIMSPLSASSWAILTISICASSTSRSRTGPIASISSRRILAARSDMLVKKR